jgi:hypothetical protein
VIYNTVILSRQRLHMTDSFGMGWKKIYYRTIRSKLGNIGFQNKPQIQLEE